LVRPAFDQLRSDQVGGKVHPELLFRPDQLRKRAFRREEVERVVELPVSGELAVGFAVGLDSAAEGAQQRDRDGTVFIFEESGFMQPGAAQEGDAARRVALADDPGEVLFDHLRLRPRFGEGAVSAAVGAFEAGERLLREAASGDAGREQQLQPVIAHVVMHDGVHADPFGIPVEGHGGHDFEGGGFAALADSGVGFVDGPGEFQLLRHFVLTGDFKLNPFRAVADQGGLGAARGGDAAVADRTDVVPAVADFAVDAVVVEPAVSAPAATVGQVEGAVRVDVEPEESVVGGGRPDGKRRETADHIFRGAQLHGGPAGRPQPGAECDHVEVATARILPVERTGLVAAD